MLTKESVQVRDSFVPDIIRSSLAGVRLGLRSKLGTIRGPMKDCHQQITRKKRLFFGKKKVKEVFKS
jgi:hypothetical protein